MGVTRKFFREGHNFQAKYFLAFFAQKVKKNGNLCLFRAKLGAFRTYEMKKKRRFFARRRRKIRNFAIFRCFRLNLGVFKASAEGASEKFRVFYTGTANDVIIFKFQGELGLEVESVPLQ